MRWWMGEDKAGPVEGLMSSVRLTHFLIDIVAGYLKKNQHL
jgi:hypothetical protein